jgi:hypothetical protein
MTATDPTSTAQSLTGDWGPWIGIDPTTKKRTHFAEPVFYPAGDYERAVLFQPGYRTDRKTYGKHGMDITWYLRGPRGVTQFAMSTGWVPGQSGIEPSISDCYPMATDLGYHALCPQYEGQEQYGRTDCHVLPEDVTCYYDGSGLNAEPVLTRFLVEGEPAIWRALAEYHDELTVLG